MRPLGRAAVTGWNTLTYPPFEEFLQLCAANRLILYNLSS